MFLKPRRHEEHEDPLGLSLLRRSVRFSWAPKRKARRRQPDVPGYFVMTKTSLTFLSLALLLTALVGPVRLTASDPGSGDWPMWGGTPDRNMVSNMKGLPTEWDIKTKKNVKWVADLGSQSYGNAVVATGMVFVGTNNEAP